MNPRFEVQTSANLLADWRLKSSESALTQGERLRLEAIVSIDRREQFLAGRWLAKKMLAQAQGGSPEDWNIDASVQTKPTVIGHDLQLSISHSGPFVACCIADHAVGIDVERLDATRPLADMATLVCSAQEQELLHRLKGDALTQRFFQLWTCKETRLKQLGLPFDVTALRGIQMAPAERADAQVGTWCILGPQKLVLSVAADGLSGSQGQWPADWVAGATQWYRYV